MKFMTNPEADALWTVRDVATFLKVSKSWVYHRAEAGELPCLRIGGLLRFLPKAIRAFAGDGGTPAPSETSPHGRK
jgi:excisionase family DNA binding protein